MTDRPPGPAKTGYGNNWVILGIVVRLPFMSRPVAVLVMAKLVIKGSNSKSRLWLARRMAGRLAAALPGRQIRVVADSAYAGGELKGLPAQVSWTTRLRKDAALHDLPPARTGRPGRPRVKGGRLPSVHRALPRRPQVRLPVVTTGAAPRGGTPHRAAGRPVDVHEGDQAAPGALPPGSARRPITGCVCVAPNTVCRSGCVQN
jgi:hypothetical protein